MSKLQKLLTNNTIITITVIIALTYEAIIIYLNKNIRGNFKKLFRDKKFMFAAITTSIWTIYMLHLPLTNPHNILITKSIKFALLALIISILASIDLKIAPFWIMFAVGYYFNIQT